MTEHLASGEWAVLLDLDGTLLDTEAAWLRAVATLLPDDDEGAAVAESVEGESLSATAALIHARFGGSRSLAEVEDEVERAAFAEFDRGIAWRPGAYELIAALDAEGVPFALVTSSPRSWVERFARVVDLTKFRLMITVDDVQRAKPHPEPYLSAARQLGLPAARCVAIEDSDIGAAAAVAAGCAVVVVRDAGRASFEGATLNISSLYGLQLESLRRLV